MVRLVVFPIMMMALMSCPPLLRWSRWSSLSLSFSLSLCEKSFFFIFKNCEESTVTMVRHNSRCIAFGHFQKFTKTYKKFCIDSIDIKS